MKRIKGRFCVIGLGNFGSSVATTLYENGHEVIVIDRNKDAVNRMSDKCTIPIVGDGSNRSFLEANGVKDMDAVVVSTGEHSELTTLITFFLVELGVKRILAKAKSEDHRRILQKIGATDVIFPEKDTAINVAKALANDSILEFIPLTDEYSITEVIPPPSFCGKTLISLDLRKKYKINVIAIKDSITENLNIAPDPAIAIRKEDVLIILGKIDNIEKLLTLK